MTTVRYPIRRLIITGEDSPTDFLILLGPLWESKATGIIKEAPRWAPRAPSAEEEVELGKVKKIKQRVAGQLKDEYV